MHPAGAPLQHLREEEPREPHRADEVEADDLVPERPVLAREAARRGVTVNCVCPGPTDTPLLAAVPDKYRDAFVTAIPMRRFGTPGEVADAILFFASDHAGYVTGQVLSVSGRLTMVG
jgi:enoyl-[acyl-carrier-protein] reductase (NADH)